MAESPPVFLPVYYEEVTSSAPRQANSTLTSVTQVTSGDLDLHHKGHTGVNETSTEGMGELALVVTFITINVFTVVCAFQLQTTSRNVIPPQIN